MLIFRVVRVFRGKDLLPSDERKQRPDSEYAFHRTILPRVLHLRDRLAGNSLDDFLLRRR